MRFAVVQSNGIRCVLVVWFQVSTPTAATSTLDLLPSAASSVCLSVAAALVWMKQSSIVTLAHRFSYSAPWTFEHRLLRTGIWKKVENVDILFYIALCSCFIKYARLGILCMTFHLFLALRHASMGSYMQCYRNMHNKSFISYCLFKEV